MSNIRFLYFISTSLLVVCLLVSCRCEAKQTAEKWKDPFDYSADTIQIDLERYFHKDCYIIGEVIDLERKTLYLPKDITIKIQRGGGFRNGIIKGDSTCLYYKSKQTIFDKVHIRGSWNVSQITSSMFKDLSYDNAIQDVIALSNPNIKNKIVIEKGTYYVTAKKSAIPCLKIGDNTELVIKGNIVLTPNSFTDYSIIMTMGNNIFIHGNGTLIGDKHTHLGKDGEWGMGIFIAGGRDVKIKGITIRDCWGDCIYISHKAQNVLIKDCVLDHGRRQGVSVISADNVTIKDCVIMNVNGKAPQYAIDIEPNPRDTVGKVNICNVTAKNCKGGFGCYGEQKLTQIKEINIRHCTIDNTELVPLSFKKCCNLSIKDCSILNFKNEKTLVCLNVDSLLVTGNSFFSKRFRDVDKKKQGSVLNKTFVVDGVINQTIKLNSIKQK